MLNNILYLRHHFKFHKSNYRIFKQNNNTLNG